MAKQTLVVESAKELSLRGGMIVILDKETGEESLRPLEDVRMVMIDHHSAKLTVPLITKLAMNNVGVVFCDATHMPVSMLMDLESNSLQSKRFRAQLSASVPTNKQLWKQIVEAKIRNQSLLLEKTGHGEKPLARYYNNVKSGDSTNREGAAARAYWHALLGKGFVRDRYGAPPNALLNYGYAVLRSVMARSLMNAGLLPTVGIFHHSCHNAFPLADDMMEPFRPFIDRCTLALLEKGITDVCREAKKCFLELFYTELPETATQLSASTLAGVYEGENRLVVFPSIH